MNNKELDIKSILAKNETPTKLLNIQMELKAPKNQTNKFGGYNYRSCEDILEAVKPLLQKNRVALTIEDDIMPVGEKIFLKSTAVLQDLDSESVLTNQAFAETSDHKGMSSEQSTGTASSYCRKYCLNGLFLIDDTKDPDTDEFHKQTTVEEKATEKQIELIKDLVEDIDSMLNYYGIEKIEDLTKKQASEIIKRKQK
jgi:hypothetical protein